jgi:hypothetical protein
MQRTFAAYESATAALQLLSLLLACRYAGVAHTSLSYTGLLRPLLLLLLLPALLTSCSC